MVRFPNIRGSLLPFLQSLTTDFDPQRGFVQRSSWRGLSLEQMENLQGDYIRAGIACRINYSGGISTLEAEDSTQEFTIDVWQIVGNEETRDGFSHPTMLSIFGDGTNLGLLRQDLDNNTKLPDLVAKLTAAGFSSFDAATAGRFYALNQRGSPEYRKGQYVLKHTTNVSNRWSANISDFGVDNIYTTAQLLSEVQSSALWILPLPARLVYKIANISAPSFKANYLWGWLKGASTETSSANNRVEITTEYTLEQWSTDYYAPF